MKEVASIKSFTIHKSKIGTVVSYYGLGHNYLYSVPVPKKGLSIEMKNGSNVIISNFKETDPIIMDENKLIENRTISDLMGVVIGGIFAKENGENVIYIEDVDGYSTPLFGNGSDILMVINDDGSVHKSVKNVFGEYNKEEGNSDTVIKISIDKNVYDTIICEAKKHSKIIEFNEKALEYCIENKIEFEQKKYSDAQRVVRLPESKFNELRLIGSNSSLSKKSLMTSAIISYAEAMKQKGGNQ